MLRTSMWWVLSISLCVGFVVLAWVSSARNVHRAVAGSLLIFVLTGVSGAAGWWAFQTQTVDRLAHVAELRASLPGARVEDEYVSSQQCRACHPGEHASWHQTYHRTMTQEALPGKVLGKFDNSEIVYNGLRYRVYQRGDEFWVEMPDPDELMYIFQGNKPLRPIDAPRITRRVVMTTGSHHYQTYWVESPKHDGVLQTLPLVWLIDDQRWIPREQAFMSPPGRHMVTQWNHHCIRCHSTGGNPGLDPKTGRLNTTVGELGIACESCHGPGAEHVRANRDPARRYALHRSGEPDPTIVNPARLDHSRSSQVCGQCHGVYINLPSKAMDFATKGMVYRPGDLLAESRYYIQHPEAVPTKEFRADFERNPEFYPERWWEDGTMLAGGREYTAMSASKCYTQGEISCLSCHSMHDAPPADQLKRGFEGSGGCTQCHTEAQYTSDVSKHTFHAPGSTGSDCLNCHMPHTTYALFGAIRNHQIRSPSAASSARFGVPNACNLCHLDKTLAWTESYLRDWYAQPEVTLTDEHRRVAASVQWILKGHAAQRAVTAWHFGWQPARGASGEDWTGGVLATLLQDPYPVVRYIAHEQLRNLPGFASFPYDFLGSAASHAEAVGRARKIWKSVGAPTRRGAEILITPGGDLDEEAIRRLLLQRDDRPFSIKE